MADDLVVLLPPSEGKAEGGTGRWAPTSGRFGRRLADPRRAVIAALGATDLTERHLGVRGELLERARTATDAIVANRARRLPAWQRYTGVVWQHLDPATLDEEQRARILVPSAMLGLVTANDPVPDHRLKFDVRLDGDGVQQRLDRFWRPHLTDALRHATTPRTTIVDLLPQEHRNAIDLDGDWVLRKRTHRPDDVPNIGGHDGKAEKGRLARRLLTGSD